MGSGLLTPKDVIAAARWILPILFQPESVLAAPDRPLREELDRVGLRGPLRSEVLEPFLAGVLGEDRGRTSDVFARLLVRTFALGAPGVPEQGIGALPAQLARTATAAGADIRLRMSARSLHPRDGLVEIGVEGAESLRARAVVVAVGPGAVSELLDIARPATNGLQTWWFASDVAPTSSGMLAVDGRRRGPVVNAVVMSNSAPSYAPPGRHLIQATCLLPAPARTDPSAMPREADVRRQLTEMWGADTSGWEVLRRDDIHDALPVRPPPLRRAIPVRLGEGLFVAGDHRDNPSIQGALTSGDRAARAVQADLGL